jgi:hypothetical protein
VWYIKGKGGNMTLTEKYEEWREAEERSTKFLEMLEAEKSEKEISDFFKKWRNFIKLNGGYSIAGSKE